MNKQDFARNISKIADEHSLGGGKGAQYHYKGETLHGVAGNLLTELGSDPSLIEHHRDMESRHRSARTPKEYLPHPTEGGG
jgi:hypothetical protein